PWTLRSLRQADRILLVADASREPLPGAVVRRLMESGNHAPVELVLVHQAELSPACDTLGWRQVCGASAHHHVVAGSAANISRVARLLTGRALGLVFGGGGARGFAHLGLIRALQERGLSVDLTGGSSMGAFISALVASGLSTD